MISLLEYNCQMIKNLYDVLWDGDDMKVRKSIFEYEISMGQVSDKFGYWNGMIDELDGCWYKQEEKTLHKIYLNGDDELVMTVGIMPGVIYKIQDLFDVVIIPELCRYERNLEYQSRILFKKGVWIDSTYQIDDAKLFGSLNEDDIKWIEEDLEQWK